MEVGGGAGAAWAGRLRWHVAGWPGWRSFLVRVLVDGLLLLAGPKFWVPGAFSAPQSAPLTQSSPRKLTSCSACSELDNHFVRCAAPPKLSRVRLEASPSLPTTPIPRGRFGAPGATLYDGKKRLRRKSFFLLRGGPRALWRGRRAYATGGAAVSPSNLSEKTPSARLERCSG